MKVWIKMDQRAAMRAGNDVKEYEAVDVDLSALTPEQRAVLADHHMVTMYALPGVATGSYLLQHTRSDPSVTLPLSSEASQAAVAALLDVTPGLIAQAQAREAEALATHEAKREAERAERAERRAAALATLAAMSDDEILANATHVEYKGGGMRTRTLNHPWRDLLGHYPVSTDIPEVQQYVDKVEQLCAAHNARVQADLDAAKAVEHAEILAWAQQHGSTRLQRALAEGIECRAVYRDERIAIERPKWEWAGAVVGDYSDPRNPGTEAFTLLDRARLADPAATLVWWEATHFCGEDCYGNDCPKYDRREYACLASYLGRKIVLFASEDK